MLAQRASDRFLRSAHEGRRSPERASGNAGLAAGTRTNVPPAHPGDAVNVLLVDTLNTDMQDQEYVRRQVMEFFAKVQPGTRMAIFVLGSKLTCLQGFTSDTSALLAALNDQRKGLKNQKSFLDTLTASR